MYGNRGVKWKPEEKKLKSESRDFDDWSCTNAVQSRLILKHLGGS